MSTVHPTAIVDDSVQLGEDVAIGPFCVIRGDVKLGDRVELISHVSIEGPCTIGAGTRVWPNASLGFGPQDYKFGPDSVTAGVVIGEDCLIRESATVHASTKSDRPTTVGDRVFLMVNAHAGHDAWIGNDVILVNNVALAGHTWVDDKAIISGGTVVHQFCRIGRMAMVSGGSVVIGDVPPFCMHAMRNALVGLNLVGLRRSGMDRSDIDAVKRVFRELLRRNLTRTELTEELAVRAESSEAVRAMYEFVRGANNRPLAATVGRTSGSGSQAQNEVTNA